MAVAEPLPATAVAAPAVQRPTIPASIVPLKGLPVVGAVVVFMTLASGFQLARDYGFLLTVARYEVPR